MAVRTFAAVAASLLAAAPAIRACSCMRSTPEEEFARRDWVYLARAERVNPDLPAALLAKFPPEYVERYLRRSDTFLDPWKNPGGPIDEAFYRSKRISSAEYELARRALTSPTMRVRVLKAWKGKPPASLTLPVGIGRGSLCERTMRVGEVYLLFNSARAPHGLTACSHNARVPDAEGIERRLDGLSWRSLAEQR